MAAAVALRMPSSYVAVEAEEMEYVEGGAVKYTSYGYYSEVTRKEWIVGVAAGLGLSLGLATRLIPGVSAIIGKKEIAVKAMKKIMQSCLPLCVRNSYYKRAKCDERSKWVDIGWIFREIF